MRNRKAVEVLSPFTVAALCVDTKSTGPCFQVMAQMAIDKFPPGPKLDALTAEKVFGWRNVHQHDDRDGFYGKRQDKAGYWRLAKVPQYSTNFLNAYSIEGRMEQLGRLDRYLRQLLGLPTPTIFPPIGLPRTNGAGLRSKLLDSTAKSFRRAEVANNRKSRISLFVCIQTSSLNQICYSSAARMRHWPAFFSP